MGEGDFQDLLAAGITAAERAADHWQAEGDRWATYDFSANLPELPNLAEGRARGTATRPVTDTDLAALHTDLQSAANRAYAIAGHYRRHLAEMMRLAREYFGADWPQTLGITLTTAADHGD
ncbi:hypothetical protein [Amycolatopsis anabasis]|uniref:hypothetical protein n=1 Tax=Amycolatopsis anabasis TaxID=1840409 RepID=UPI00131EAA7B|nr:hypothetical protein [Amycolatopsis anabasis]